MSVAVVETVDPLQAERVFLSAEWRDLLMLNYRVDPELLREYVPKGTELDFFHGSTFVSLVGFRFLRTRMLGVIGIPFHSNFDEINLRFYVRRRNENEHRRGVAFIREIVPRQLVATVARLVYGENYVCHPVRHRISEDRIGKTTEYEWGPKGKKCQLLARASGTPVRPAKGTLEEFITEHYWGYSVRDRSRCFEYRVSHVPWRVWVSNAACFRGDGTSTYGQRLGAILSGKPDSAFVAEGSQVFIHAGRVVT